MHIPVGSASETLPPRFADEKLLSDLIAMTAGHTSALTENSIFVTNSNLTMEHKMYPLTLE